MLKIFTVRPFNWSRFFSSGGMPSSHSAFVSSLSVMIGLNNGFKSDIFAVTVVFSLITMYDATGVRQAVGKQAVVLNRLAQRLAEAGNKDFPFDELKELIGHTPVEVFSGALLGIVLALLLY